MTTTELLDRAERLLDLYAAVLGNLHRAIGITPALHRDISAIDAWKRDRAALKAKCPDCTLPREHCACGDDGEYVLTPVGEAVAKALKAEKPK